MSLPKCAAEADLPEGALAARLGEGDWRCGEGRAVAVWRDGALCALVCGQGQARAAPGDVAWVMDAAEVRLPFGVADVGPVLVRTAPRVEARLGIHGLLTLRLAHAAGLWTLLGDVTAGELSWHEARTALRPALLKAARGAVAECLGDAPWAWQDVRGAVNSGAMQGALARRLFREIYPFGLVAPPQDTRLLDVACARETGT